jgi:predicted TIM-barrel fold metal-dependent hydrolase
MAHADPLIVVSSDTHIGPRMQDDLRPYCPARHLDAFDAAVAGNAGALVALGKAFEDASDPETSRGLNFRRNWQTEGHHDIAARLRDMDFDGVAAEVIFHGSQNGEPIPFQHSGAFFGALPDDPELAAVGLHIYNQWLADFVSTAPERHVGLAHLPMWDVDAAIAELEWAANAGLRSVNFPAPRTTLPPYNNPVWEPFWSACEHLHMPLTTHAGAGDPSSWSGPETICLLSLESGGWPARRAMHFMILGGVFERHPELKLVLTEQPGDWWPGAIADIDSTYIASRSTPGLAEQCPDLPSEYARRNVFIGASFLARYEAEHAVREGYTRQVMWGSDYPHMEGTFQYPGNFDEPSVGKMAMRFTFAGLPPDDVRAMAGENAVDVYGLDRDALRKVAETIDAPTIDELSQPLDAIPTTGSVQAFRTVGAWS